MTRPVAVLPDPVLASLVRTLLEEHGVRALEVQTQENAMHVGGDAGFYVEVAGEDVSRAMEVLAATDLAKWLLTKPQRPQSSR